MSTVRRSPTTNLQQWWLYLLACTDGRTYAGIALDVQARFEAHLSGKASKFTRANPPVSVLGVQAFATKSAALKAEIALKKLDRPAKLAWARAQADGRVLRPRGPEKKISTGPRGTRG